MFGAVELTTRVTPIEAMKIPTTHALLKALLIVPRCRSSVSSMR